MNSWNSLFRLRTAGSGLSKQCIWGAEVPLAVSDVRALLHEPPTLEDVPAGPWAAVVVEGGSIRATASTTLSSGLFWCVSRSEGSEELLIAPCLGAVVSARFPVPELDRSWLLEFALLCPKAEGTPYMGIHRLPPGRIAVWSAIDRPPAIRAWSGADAWAVPHRQGTGVLDLYRRTFDEAVNALLRKNEPICASLSGGLDSSFLVASLVRHSRVDAPIQAFCHVPHPGAELKVTGNWDPDELAVAREMELAYPGLVQVHPVVNDGRHLPLDAAADFAERTWAPTVNPANMAWIMAMAQRAEDIGSSRLFLGTNGNVAFSYEHSYAARFHAARGEFGALVDLVRQGHAGGLPWPKAIRYRLLSPLFGPLRSRLRRSGPPSYAASIGLGKLAPPSPNRLLNRQGYLNWLGGNTGLHIVQQPVGGGALMVDPFCDARLLAMAASIRPVEWCRGPYPRGYARLLGEGRVPDTIRLRTRRGGQSWDNWYLIRHQRERYFDELNALAVDSVLGPVVDLAYLRGKLESLPWGEVAGPSAEVGGIDRLLSLAGFVRRAEERLRELRRSTPKPAPTAPN